MNQRSHDSSTSDGRARRGQRLLQSARCMALVMVLPVLSIALACEICCYAQECDSEEAQCPVQARHDRSVIRVCHYTLGQPQRTGDRHEPKQPVQARELSAPPLPSSHHPPPLAETGLPGYASTPSLFILHSSLIV